jgi:hypothetical protein
MTLMSPAGKPAGFTVFSTLEVYLSASDWQRTNIITVLVLFVRVKENA